MIDFDYLEEIELKFKRVKIQKHLLEEAYDVLAQQYHILVRSNFKDKHVTEYWKDCNEQSCRNLQETIKMIREL